MPWTFVAASLGSSDSEAEAGHPEQAGHPPFAIDSHWARYWDAVEDNLSVSSDDDVVESPASPRPSTTILSPPPSPELAIAVAHLPAPTIADMMNQVRDELKMVAKSFRAGL